MLRLLPVWLAVAAAFALSPTGAAAQTMIIGGPGGGNFGDRCAPGAYLVAVHVVAGKDMNTITAVCQTFVNGNATGQTVALRTWGKWVSNGSYGLDTFSSCPPNSAAVAMQVQVSHVALVHTVALLCRNPNAQGNPIQAKYSATGGGQSAFQKLADCGAGSVSNGLVGRYGALVDALGLSCQSLPPRH